MDQVSDESAMQCASENEMRVCVCELFVYFHSDEIGELDTFSQREANRGIDNSIYSARWQLLGLQ